MERFGYSGFSYGYTRNTPNSDLSAPAGVSVVRWVGEGVFSGHGWTFPRQMESIHGFGGGFTAANAL